MTGTRPCPDCGHQVSMAARACPGCGRIIRPDDLRTPEEREKQRRGCLIVIGILLILMFLLFLPYLNETPEQRRRAEDDAVKRSLGLPK